jgi:hypothetical protein
MRRFYIVSLVLAASFYAHPESFGADKGALDELKKAPVSDEELQQRTREKAVKWLNGQKAKAEDELEALVAHRANLRKAIKKADEAVALARRVEDEEALKLAQEVAKRAREEEALVAEKIVRQEGIQQKLAQAFYWAIPKDGSLAVPVEIHGEVRVRSASGWEPIGNAPLKKGDQVMTGDGHAEFIFGDGNRIYVGPHASFIYKGKTDDGSIYGLLKGKLHTIISAADAFGGVIRYKTVTAITSVRGTEFDLEVDEKGFTHLYPFSGKIELAADPEGMKQAKPERWWEQGAPKDHTLSKSGDMVKAGASAAKVDLKNGYTAVLAPGSELEFGKDDAGEPVYILTRGRMYVSRNEKGESAKPPRFIASNATATPSGAAFEVKLREDGLADFIPLAGMVEVEASREGLDLEKVKPYWKE